MRTGFSYVMSGCVASLSLGALAVVLTGGCPLTLERSLPNDLDASMRQILNHKAVFGQSAVDAHAPAGTVVDPLSDLAGCWGAVVEGVAGRGPMGQMDWYSLLRFGPDGTLTSWSIADLGGLVGYVWVTRGRYEVVGTNRLRFVGQQERYYDPLTRAYHVSEGEPGVTEWLATLEGEILRLRMLDYSGAPAPSPSEPDYTIVYRAFRCLE